jgi:chromate transporter
MSALFRMMMPLIRKRDWIGIAIMAAVFVAIGVLRLPLPPVLLASIPLSIGISFATARKVSG